ncbi:MAG: hypothetical protein ACYTXT_33475 [Nostoc sp.]
MEISLIGEKAIAKFGRRAIAFVMCTKNVVVQHNAFKKIWRSHQS